MSGNGRTTFKDHFSDRSADYASCRPVYPANVAVWLASISPRRERAWDAGCGSGQMSAQLAEHFDDVVGTDPSMQQLAHARAHARLRYVCSRAEQSGLRDGSVDLATAAQAAHWFDLPRYWREVRRVVRPGGVVALVTYCLCSVSEAIDEIVGRYYEEWRQYWPPERAAIEDGYRSIDFPFDEIDAPPIQMRERWSADHFLGYVATWSAVRGLERAGRIERFRAFEAELRDAWGEEERDVIWPIAMRVGVNGV